MTGWTELAVRGVEPLAERVIGLTLVHPDGAALAAWTPGAHIDLALPSGAIRSYSLCGDPADRYRYRIAVLRDDAGRGGSAEIHATSLAGQRLRVAGPRSAFAVADAPRHVFVAGGIGVTPLLPMWKEAIARGAECEFHYLGRSRGAMAFVDELASHAAQRAGVSVQVFAGDEGRRADLAALIGRLPPGTALYGCGPERLLAVLEALSATPGAVHTLHVERFGRPDLAPAEPIAADVAEGDDFRACDPDGPFEVRMNRSGVTVQIPSGGTILEVVRQVRRDLTFSCSSGYCGTCETRVLGGTPDHRDEVLSDDEKAANASMMICVGRSRTATLVLDL